MKTDLIKAVHMWSIHSNWELRLVKIASLGLQADLSSVSWRLADGLMQCRFSRPVKLSSPETRRFSLDQEYFLFLANGHAQHGNTVCFTLEPTDQNTSSCCVGTWHCRMHHAELIKHTLINSCIGEISPLFFYNEWNIMQNTNINSLFFA